MTVEKEFLNDAVKSAVMMILWCYHFQVAVSFVSYQEDINMFYKYEFLIFYNLKPTQ